jgi:hypothetical protein
LKYEQTSEKLSKKMTEIIKKYRVVGCQDNIKTCDEEITDYQDEKFIRIMSQNYQQDRKKMDWEIDFFDGCLKTSKLEKQFWVAIDKNNWKLMGLVRIKVRESSDWMMEHMEMGVENNWMNEENYISSANNLKKALEDMENVINMMRRVWQL